MNISKNVSHSYWVGQKFTSWFSVISYRKTQMNFFANSIFYSFQYSGVKVSFLQYSGISFNTQGRRGSAHLHLQKAPNCLLFLAEDREWIWIYRSLVTPPEIYYKQPTRKAQKQEDPEIQTIYTMYLNWQ